MVIGSMRRRYAMWRARRLCRSYGIDLSRSPQDQLVEQVRLGNEHAQRLNQMLAAAMRPPQHARSLCLAHTQAGRSCKHLAMLGKPTCRVHAGPDPETLNRVEREFINPPRL